jgi:kumamolisin
MARTAYYWLGGLAVLSAALSAIAAPPQAIDRGPLKALAGDTPISVTIALALPALDEAEKLQQALYTPGEPQFHKFLTADQFVARFAPSDAEIARVIAALTRYGLAAEKTTATTLRVSGLPADMEQAFSVSLHSYEVAPQDKSPGYTYHAPLSRPTIPAEISAAVATVAGLDNHPVAHPHLQTAHLFKPPESPGVPLKATGNPLGLLTVNDFASQYDVEPLYNKGVTGRGRTIGIVTLAAFTPSDAYKYWQAVGLKVASNRIQVVNIDGGPGAPSDASGSLETALDVEQSGGVAPAAKIIVYQAPNTGQGWVDAFAAAIDANLADSFSTSWGNWEWFFANTEAYPAVIDPITGRTVVPLQAFQELLLRAAIQGQSASAASGDGGGYDVVNDLGCQVPYSAAVANSCSATLTVDYPASDPLMTAGGGTTLPGQLQFCLNAACTPPYYDINIPHESVWGWDYLEGLCKVDGYSDPVSCGIFPWGGGGGVSIEFAEPLYQFGLNGIQLSQPGQAFSLQPYGLLDSLPANYAGRNVPDVANFANILSDIVR